MGNGNGNGNWKFHCKFNLPTFEGLQFSRKVLCICMYPCNPFGDVQCSYMYIHTIHKV